jgi:excisionase family DNA binding protein
MNKNVPIWEKYALTIREAAEYFHIGEKRMRKIVEQNRESDFVVMLGNRAMIKRKSFEQFLDRSKEL